MSVCLFCLQTRGEWNTSLWGWASEWSGVGCGGEECNGWAEWVAERGGLHHGVLVHVSLPQYTLLLLKFVEWIESAQRRAVIMSCYYFRAVPVTLERAQGVCPGNTGADT